MADLLPTSTEYTLLHRWINEQFPRTGRCEFCATTSRRTGYASIEHRYTRSRMDWLELCSRCHFAYDERGRRKREKTHCKRGHPFNATNTYLRSNGSRMCVPCQNDLRRPRRRRADR